jgi:hypothetical protein
VLTATPVATPSSSLRRTCLALPFGAPDYRHRHGLRHQRHPTDTGFGTNVTLGLVSFQKNLQNFSDFASYRIFRHMHGILNIGENKN